MIGCCGMSYKWVGWASLIFIMAHLLAMVVFPGGTLLNSEASQYYFHLNFFSDLGRLTAYNGQSQLLSYSIYAGGLTYFMFVCVLWCLSKALYFFMAAAVSPALRAVIVFDFILYALVAVFFIIQLYIPPDISRITHIFYVKCGFYSSLVAHIMAMILLYVYRARPLLKIVWMLFIIYTFIYVLLAFNLLPPPYVSEYYLMIHVLMQKVIVYFNLLCIPVFAFFVDHNMVKKVNT